MSHLQVYIYTHPPGNNSSIVYKIPCNCWKVYVGDNTQVGDKVKKARSKKGETEKSLLLQNMPGRSIILS